MYGRAVWLEGEIDSFLYEGGPTPFPEEEDIYDVMCLKSGMIRDEFQPEIDGPWVDCPIWNYKDWETYSLAYAEKGGDPDVQAALDALEALDDDDPPHPSWA